MAFLISRACKRLVIISEVPDPFSDDEQRSLQLHTPARTYSWPDWSDLVADLESSAEIRALILAVELSEPGEKLLRTQASARTVNARLSALEALRACDR